MTNKLYYSTNEGITWNNLTFYDEPLKIFGLLTEPGENTTVFTMFGTQTLGKPGVDWIIITVKFISLSIQWGCIYEACVGTLSQV